jgi:hypothetical protein
MAANTTTLPFLVAAAREAMATRELKGLRPKAASMFIDADTEDDRAEVVLENAGIVRRGLREQAKHWAKTDEEVANVFWMLRDAIDESEGTVNEDMLDLNGGVDNDND